MGHDLSDCIKKKKKSCVHTYSVYLKLYLQKTLYWPCHLLTKTSGKSQLLLQVNKVLVSLLFL